MQQAAGRLAFVHSFGLVGSSAPVGIAVLAGSDRFVFGDSFALAGRLADASKPALADRLASG